VSVAAVLVAAGSGTRFGDQGKVFAPLGGRPVLHWSIELFRAQPGIVEIVVVFGEHSFERGQALLEACRDDRLAAHLGGATRTGSVRAGVEALQSEAQYVAVHDAARPLASPALLTRVLEAARLMGAAVPSMPVADTVQSVTADGTLLELLDRERLRAVQTPQVARRDWLLAALAQATPATDEGSLLHLAGYPVRHVDGERDNLKLTWPSDLLTAEALLAGRAAAR
jgi:2-C-methyl-D-erythritol 4-phosphate cytidylyltransferase